MFLINHNITDKYWTKCFSLPHLIFTIFQDRYYYCYEFIGQEIEPQRFRQVSQVLPPIKQLTPCICWTFRSGNLCKCKPGPWYWGKLIWTPPYLHKSYYITENQLCFLKQPVETHINSSQLAENGYIFSEGSKSEEAHWWLTHRLAWFTIRNSFIRKFSFQQLL